MPSLQICLWCGGMTYTCHWIDSQIKYLCAACIGRCVKFTLLHAGEEEPLTFLNREFPMEGDDNARENRSEAHTT